MKRYLWSVVYGVMLTAFTVYLALDTFVITRVYETAPDAAVPSAPQPRDPVVTANSYEDGIISITIAEHREHDTTIYVADVTLASPEYLRTALAQGVYGRNVTQKTSAMAEDVGAILAINGDYYGSRERGFVVRNGVLYRATANRDAEALIIGADGSFTVVDESGADVQSLVDAGAQHILSFGPALVEKGEIVVTTEDEVGKAMADNPRTAIGIIDEGHYILLVSDGRTDESAGLTLYQLAEFMQGLGVQTAYNLDGGGSSTMVFMGEVINNPTTNGRRITERSVSDIVYIGY
ncbi:MAG: phosphodiester glycosidase family protein [Clostridia bacterium]|nr:phosphodiester glycosidase family protein [Clostridia bacterium]